MKSHHKDHPPQLIEISLRSLSQLFNSMDPSPFHEKDLDQDAEDFMVGWALEHPVDAPLKLVLHLQEWPPEDPQPRVSEAIHHYFEYRARLVDMEFHQLMQIGRTSLIIGLAFLISCLLVSEWLRVYTGVLPTLVREGFTIAGWVAMWRPMQLYLYDWWPLRRRAHIYRKMSRMPVQVKQKKA